MALSLYYREMMEINSLKSDEEKAEASEKFFEKIKKASLPTHANWVLDCLEEIHGKERPDQEALIWANLDKGDERRYTYRELIEEGNRLLNFLRKRGLAKGEVVYLITPGFPEVWFTMVATIKGGMILVPTAVSMTADELAYRFSTYRPAAIVGSIGTASVIDEALNRTGIKPKVKIAVGSVAGWTPYEEVNGEAPLAEAANTVVSDIIICFFTSGTMGLPKRVVHSAVSYPLGHLSTVNLIGLKPGDMHLNLSQPGWAKYAWSSFFAPLMVGATTVIFHYERLQPEVYLEGVAKYKINTFCAPPTAWRSFILTDLSKFDFSALRESMSAGEPLNPEIIHTWKKFTGNEIRDFYGQTETTAMIGNPPWQKGRIVPGSFGQPHFLYDVVLLDDEGREITKPKEVGHIAIRLSHWRPSGLFLEYLGDKEKMAESFRGPYYYTGDRAYRDRDGYWWFEGRADDVIKSSDYRIGPFEVESALLEHPAVAEAAVVGSPDAKRWQLVKAFVVLAPGFVPSRELALEIFSHCKKVLAKYKIPRILEFVSELPKTASGKIRRLELKEREIKTKGKGERGVYEFFYHEFTELNSSRL